MKTAPLTGEQERLYGGAPKDRHGIEIVLGSRVLFAVKDGDRNALHEGLVAKIHEPSHRGYGYMTRKITVRREDKHELDKYQKQTYTLSYPEETVVLERRLLA